MGALDLLELLRQQAVQRGLAHEDTPMSPETVFALVRDMPYQRASSREPEATLKEWRGTCSGKHYLLKALFEEIGLEARLVMCTHVFTRLNTQTFPESLRKRLNDGPIPDVHTFIRLKSGKEWHDVDATWPMATKRLGMPVNERFQPGVNMAIACEPIATFEVPDDVEPQAFKERLIQSHCGKQSKQRDLFIEKMSQWLRQNTP